MCTVSLHYAAAKINNDSDEMDLLKSTQGNSMLAGWGIAYQTQVPVPV